MPNDAATKSCPFCAETILAGARKCKFCKSDLEPQAEGVNHKLEELASLPSGGIRCTNCSYVGEPTYSQVGPGIGCVVWLFLLLTSFTLVMIPVFVVYSIWLLYYWNNRSPVCPDCDSRTPIKLPRSGRGLAALKSSEIELLLVGAAGVLALADFMWPIPLFLASLGFGAVGIASLLNSRLSERRDRFLAWCGTYSVNRSLIAFFALVVISLAVSGWSIFGSAPGRNPAAEAIAADPAKLNEYEGRIKDARATLRTGDVSSAIDMIETARTSAPNKELAEKASRLGDLCREVLSDKKQCAALADLSDLEFTRYKTYGVLPELSVFNDADLDAAFGKVLLTKRSDADYMRESELRRREIARQSENAARERAQAQPQSPTPQKEVQTFKCGKCGGDVSPWSGYLNDSSPKENRCKACLDEARKLKEAIGRAKDLNR